jgi:hypothetical protein
MGMVAMIIAGTRIRLRDEKILRSAVGKLGEGSQIVIHTGAEFRYLKVKTGGCLIT